MKILFFILFYMNKIIIHKKKYFKKLKLSFKNSIKL